MKNAPTAELTDPTPRETVIERAKNGASALYGKLDVLLAGMPASSH